MKQKPMPMPALEACDMAIKRRLLKICHETIKTIVEDEGCGEQHLPLHRLMICSGKHKRFCKLFSSFKTSKL